MNTNSGKTGIINIPSALHSTGGDGDGHVGNVVAYAGDIFDDRVNKNQRDINKEFSDKFKKSLVLDDTNSIAIQTSSFYFTLSGDNSTYTTLLYGNDQYTNYFGGYIAKTFVNTDLLDYYGEKVATISGITFQNNQLVFNLDTNLGELNNENFYANCPHGQNSFLYGCYASKGMYPVLLGQFNLNAGTSPKILGDNNCNSATSPSIVGNSNFINGEGAHVAILGDYNNVSGDSYMFVVGEGNNMHYTNNEFYGIGLNNNVYSQKLIAFNLGSNNTFQKGQNAGNGWINQFAFGHDLTITQDGFVVGTQNVNYDSSDSSIRNFFVVANSGNTLEIKHNGDMYVKGLGNFNGANSSASTVQSLQEVVSGIQTSIDQSTGGVDEFTVEQMIKAQSASINNMLNTVNANSDRIKITLTGSGTTYSGTTGDEMKDRIFVAALSNYPSIYQTSSSEQELAAVRSASYNTNSQEFVLTLTNSLGNLNNANYYITAKAKPSSVCLGGYMQSGYVDNVIGSENFVKGNNTNVYGGYNTVSGDTVSVIGKVNIAVENSEILGNNNKILKNSCGIMGEFNEIPSSAQTESYLIGSNNKIKGNFRGYSLGRYNTFQPQLASGETGVALGEYLTLFNGGIAIGKYNFNDYVQSADKQSFFTVSNGQSKYSGKNLIDVKKDGSFYLYGAGGYDGASTANPAIQTVQEVLNQLSTDIQTVSANTDTIINHHFTENNSIKIGTAINVSGTDSIAAGAGVNLTGNRTFGYGISMGAIYLTGDEGIYSARIHSNANYTNANNIGPVFATTHLNSYLLNTSNFSRVAKITNIVYNGENQPLTLTLDTDLGELTNAVYAIENVAGTKSFNGGSFGNTGQNSSVIGLNNFNTGNSSNILGSVNANTAGTATVLGYLNKNNGSNSNVFGSLNNNSGVYGNVIGLQNTNSGQYANIVGRNNNNKCASTNILGIANTVNETTYPSSILGFENNADATTQQFTLGYQNHGTRGQYAEGNVSASFMFGHNLTTSSGCYAIGKYNKDYDVQDVAKQNFFVIGQGNSERALNNLEVKNNGNWYVYGVGGFDGTNSDSATVKTLQAKIAELEARIAQLEGGNS